MALRSAAGFGVLFGCLSFLSTALKAIRKGSTPCSDSELSDREWTLLAHLLPPLKPGGRRRCVDLRERLRRQLGRQPTPVPRSLTANRSGPPSMVRLMLKRPAHEQVQPASHYRQVA